MRHARRWCGWCVSGALKSPRSLLPRALCPSEPVEEDAQISRSGDHGRRLVARKSRGAPRTWKLDRNPRGFVGVPRGFPRARECAFHDALESRGPGVGLADTVRAEDVERDARAVRLVPETPLLQSDSTRRLGLGRRSLQPDGPLPSRVASHSWTKSADEPSARAPDVELETVLPTRDPRFALARSLVERHDSSAGLKDRFPFLMVGQAPTLRRKSLPSLGSVLPVPHVGARQASLLTVCRMDA